LKKKNTPVSATNRADKKIVRTINVQQTPHPSWRFSTVDLEGPFAWPRGEDIETQILEKLRNFDSMRWNDISNADHHAIAIERLSKEAQQRLAEIKQDDIDEIFSFHFSGKRRIIGIRDMSIVKLLWWDPDHLVCLSLKKNT
jgi:hypothetical protein